MAKCNLIIDSCCDVPASMIEGEGITLLRFPYILNGMTYYDDMFTNTSPKDFYDKMREGAAPSTSQLPLTVLQDAFTQACESGIPTVYLSFTSGLSGNYDTACLIRDQVLADYPQAELYVVDTLQACSTEGLFVLEAIRQREKGLSAKELTDWAMEARHFVDELFMIEDLDVLKRGGRISSTVALAGGALDVKPMLTIDADGRLVVNGISRGRKKGMKSLVAYYEKNRAEHSGMSDVLIANADCPKDAERVADMIRKADPRTNVSVVNVGPVIGSHVGPDMVAVVFWGKDKRDSMSIADRIARRVKGE